MYETSEERPQWYYSHLSQETLEIIATKAPALLKCLCGGVVTAARMGLSRADDGPAYLYCENCYCLSVNADKETDTPIVEEDIPIEFWDIALSEERPQWYYSHLSQETLETLAAKAPALLKCLCGGVVTAARMSPSGADDGPAYLYCENCYRLEILADKEMDTPIVEDEKPIEYYDILLWRSDL